MKDHGLELWTLDPGISDAEGRLLQATECLRRYQLTWIGRPSS